jgi:hypothetical protein
MLAACGNVLAALFPAYSPPAARKVRHNRLHDRRPASGSLLGHGHHQNLPATAAIALTQPFTRHGPREARRRRHARRVTCLHPGKCHVLRGSDSKS